MDMVMEEYRIIRDGITLGMALCLYRTTGSPDFLATYPMFHVTQGSNRNPSVAVGNIRKMNRLILSTARTRSFVMSFDQPQSNNPRVDLATWELRAQHSEGDAKA